MRCLPTQSPAALRRRPLLSAHQLGLVHEEELDPPLKNEAQPIHQVVPLDDAPRLRGRVGQRLLGNLVLAYEGEDGAIIGLSEGSNGLVRWRLVLNLALA